MPETPKMTTAQALSSLIKSCRDIMRKDKGLSTDIDRLPMLTWIMFLKFLDDLEPVRKAEASLAGKRFQPAIEPPYRWCDWGVPPEGITGIVKKSETRNVMYILEIIEALSGWSPRSIDFTLFIPVSKSLRGNSNFLACHFT